MADNKNTTSDLDTNQVFPLSAQSAATRARLIATAERLFAERGIDSVSLSEINLAAGQRNKNASHYHFGEKKGLLQAVLDKHLPGVILRRDRMLDELEARGEFTEADAIRTLLYPLAEKLFDSDGGREFLRINAQLAVRFATVVLNPSGTDSLQLGSLHRVQAAISQFLGHLPKTIAEQRVTLATSLMLNGLADHSRWLESDQGQSSAAVTEIFIRNLEDCLLAMCLAPVSDPVNETLGKIATTTPAARTPNKKNKRK